MCLVLIFKYTVNVNELIFNIIVVVVDLMLAIA